MAASEAGRVRYAHNGDVRIAYEDLGGAGGDPLLLVMGMGVSRFWWPALAGLAGIMAAGWSGTRHAMIPELSWC
jgi:hypothetical protein